MAGLKDKLNKANLPEDAFYHVFEMKVDGSGLRQLTRGKYDDFDARYLPGGRIVFLSTRRGHAVRVDSKTAARILEVPDLPDCYVRCGGGPSRPVAVYTLHTMKADGTGIDAISPFEMFEWTPHVAPDGRILYSRWDYVDRTNSPYMSLWSTAPDGTNARLVYGNYTRSPHCTFEPRYVPGSHKIVFTASAHHAQTMGSLCLLDPTVGTEGAAPVTRLTPEAVFPEIEGWPDAYYAHPWPLSERLYLVAWGRETRARQGGRRPVNGMGLYLFSSDGEMELIHRDPEISSAWPLPVKPRDIPHELPNTVERFTPATDEGAFLLADVHRGLKTVGRGDIKSLRIVAVPVKTHPSMNRPQIGLT
ncbi:MAG: TolB family protein, partial [Planctomycetota bacterium]